MIGRKATLFFSSRVFDNLVSFFVLVFVAREMGPEPIGIIGYCAGIVGLFSLIAGLGFTTTHKKKISEGMDLGRCIGTYVTIKVVSIIIWILLFLTWLIYNKYYKNSFILENDAELVLYVVVIYTIVFQLSDVISSTYIAKGELAKATVPTILSRLVTAFSKIFVVITGFGVVFLAISQLIGYIFLFFVLLFFFRKYPFKLPNIDYLKSYFIFTLPIFFIVVMATLTVSLDKIMIGYYWGFSEVSFYTVPSRISYLLLLISTSLSTVLLPKISKKNAEGDTKYIMKIVPLIEKYVVLILTPIIVFIMVFSEEIILSLFGKDFLPSAILLIYLSIIAYIDASTRIYTTQIVSIGRVKLSFIIGICIFIPHIILNFIFIPESFLGYGMLGMGAKGAAIATLVGTIFGMISARFCSYYTMKIKQNYRIFLYLIAGIIMYFIMISIKELL